MIHKIRRIEMTLTLDQLFNIGQDIANLYSRAKFGSKSHVRKMIKQGAVRVHGHQIKDPFARLCFFEDTFYIVERVEEHYNHRREGQLVEPGSS